MTPSEMNETIIQTEEITPKKKKSSAGKIILIIVIIFSLLCVACCVVGFVTLNNPDRTDGIVGEFVGRLAEMDPEQIGVDNWYRLNVLDYLFENFKYVSEFRTALKEADENPAVLSDAAWQQGLLDDLDELQRLNDEIVNLEPKSSLFPAVETTLPKIGEQLIVIEANLQAAFEGVEALDALENSVDVLFGIFGDLNSLLR